MDSKPTVAQPNAPVQLCSHMRAFVDFYIKSAVLVMSAPIGTPVVALCSLCSDEPPQMIDSGEGAR